MRYERSTRPTKGGFRVAPDRETPRVDEETRFSFFRRLRGRRTVEWGLAYLAGALIVREVGDAFGERWGLPRFAELFEGRLPDLPPDPSGD